MQLAPPAVATPQQAEAHLVPNILAQRPVLAVGQKLDLNDREIPEENLNVVAKSWLLNFLGIYSPFRENYRISYIMGNAWIYGNNNFWNGASPADFIEPGPQHFSLLDPKASATAYLRESQ